VRYAQDTIRRYDADAMINGLDFDRHEEHSAVGVLAAAFTMRRRVTSMIR